MTIVGSTPDSCDIDIQGTRGLGIKGKLMLSFGAVALITVVAGGFGFASYGRIEASFQKVRDHSLPAMTNSFEMVEQAAALSALASSIAAASDPEQHRAAGARIADHEADLHKILGGLSASSLPSAEVEPLTALTDNLLGSLNDLEQKVGERLELSARTRRAIEEVNASHGVLIEWLGPRIEEANAELTRQTEETTGNLSGQIETLMSDGVGRLQSALVMRAEINLMAGILIEAVVAPNRGVLEAAADRFTAAEAAVEEQASLLAEQDSFAELEKHIADLKAVGNGPEGVFTMRRAMFEGSSASAEGGQAVDPVAWTKQIYTPRETILAILEPIVDEASFDLIIQSEEAVEGGSKTIHQLIDRSVASLRAYLGITADANWLAGLLRQASMERERSLLDPLAKEIGLAIEALQGYQATLAAAAVSGDEPDLLLQPLQSRAVGPESIVALRVAALALEREEQASVVRTRDQAARLTERAHELVALSRDEVVVSSRSVGEAIAGGRWLLVILSISSLAIAAAIIAFYVGPRIIAPLAAISSSVARLARGEQIAVPGTERSDELGALARSLSVIHERAVEATRIQRGLDSADASVMITDNNQKIIYVNAKLNQMFKDAEGDIRRELPEFAADRLLGGAPEILSKRPEVIRRILEGLTQAHHEQTTIGGRNLSFVASPVVGPDGQRLGTVIQWQDETEERQLRQAIEAVLQAASAGDFTKRIETGRIEGAMAGFAGGINQLTKLVEGATRDLGSMLASLAKGDLSQRITTDYQGTLGDLKTNANQTAEKLASIVAEIQSASTEVGQAAAEITSGTSDLAGRTEQAAANLEETAASTEQMAATVKKNAENADTANQLAGEANQAAGKGGMVVERAVTAMGDIEESATKITDIIGVIDEIAFQTNLLALNASVEAARAGEAGKGFAVVAQEVRQLAQRASTAASDIKALIENSNLQVKNGAQLVGEAGRVLGDIVSSIGQVASIVDDISSASQEQAVGIQEINRSIASMDDMTQQNSALVEESTAAARALNDQADKLTEQVAFFKLDRTTTAGALPPGSRQTRCERSDGRRQGKSSRRPVMAGQDDLAMF